MAQRDGAKVWTSTELPLVVNVVQVGGGNAALNIRMDPWKEGVDKDIYIDGSGDSADPGVRRCGWGVAWLGHDGDDWMFVGGFFGNLGDEKHTVAKAEVEALLQALRRRGGGEKVTIWTDCKYVKQGCDRRVWRGKGPKRHADRWKLVGELMDIADDESSDSDNLFFQSLQQAGAKSGLVLSNTNS